MNGRVVLGIVLVVLGVAALAWGGFSYTEETHSVEIGSLELAAKERNRLEIPTWLGALVVAGGVVLVLAGRRR